MDDLEQLHADARYLLDRIQQCEATPEDRINSLEDLRIIANCLCRQLREEEQNRRDSADRTLIDLAFGAQYK